MLERLALTCYAHRRLVVVGWIVALAALLTLGGTAGGDFETDFELPGSESQAAYDLLAQSGFEDRTGASGQIVFEAGPGVEDPAVRDAMEELFAAVEDRVPGTTVVSPYVPGGSRQIAASGTIAYAEVNFVDRDQADYVAAGEEISALRDRVHVPGLQVELGGDVFLEESGPPSEGIGLLAAMVVLLVAFGSVLAMGLPILTALFGIGCGVALVQLATHLTSIPEFATPAVAMIGIGVGIDYALFVVTRYRQALSGGLDPQAAVVLAVRTAGRAVVFAGTTVVISMMGMLLFGLSVISGVAVGTSLAVLMTMLAAVTLLPAVLGFVGRTIDRLGLPHRHRAEGTTHPSLWRRWSRVVQHRPWPAAVTSLVLLLGVAAPVLGLRLGFADAGIRPETDTTRRAHDLLSEGFGPGFNGPLLLAASTPGGPVDLAALQALSQRLGATPGVALATPPIANQDGTAAILQVVPTTSPQAESTGDLVHHLRESAIPEALGQSPTVVHVGGGPASIIDFADYTASRQPLFVGAVLGLSFLLLMVVFRSVLVPLKAVIMNLLTIGAAYGVVVAVFQWGWGADLVGAEKGPVEVWVPTMLFAIVFGLSMDYEVFLLSRIREEYDRTGDNGSAVADGLAATARVITAAAAVMVCVFGSFVLGDERAIQMFGLGLAVAVLLDATLVRLVLVPATMELLGDRNWWLPGWLGRLLPAVPVERSADLQEELDRLAGARSPVGTG